SDGILTLSSAAPLAKGFMAYAQLPDLPPINVTIDHYLEVAVLSSSEFLAVRIAIGLTNTSTQLLMLSTFNGNAWRVVTIDLAVFALVGVWSFPNVQLGFEVIEAPTVTNPAVSFEFLAIGDIENV
ncbi:MAG TPA: hypothetical protein VEJ87_00335, partial [Acidimicrobiales bacterium]|nr:hypothetical protein [Acidimicrobiales bacterium]